ncbi:MAG TPA: thioredoxin family protein [Ignavibacteria bacterium]|nr:thioredoxin family protein [Ignavibacteria bacterium]HMR39523.1 thioredoxin family protein [Ignavibacteria bacterium]
MKSIITQQILDNAISYEEYKNLVMNLISKNDCTGDNKSESNIYFTKLNAERAKRIEKTTAIDEDFKKEVEKINYPLVFFVIAESWCGDVAQNLPVINRIAELNPNIKLRIILRDENENIMNEFLTNGTRSIPVCVLLDGETFEVQGKWGPRPGTAMSLMREYKNNPDVSHAEANKNIQLWYAKDHTKNIQSEFLEMISKINRKKQPLTS